MEPYVAERNGLDLVVGKQREENKGRAEPDSTPPEGQNGRRSALGPVPPGQRKRSSVPTSPPLGFLTQFDKRVALE